MSERPTPGSELRGQVSDLVAEYAHRIDANALESWLELFTPDCDYRVVSRENVEQGLPGIIMWCDSWAMLRDRVESYRHVNEYNLHWDRHVIGPLRYISHEAGLWTVEASYQITQTSMESGVSTLFSVGQYRFGIVASEAGVRFKSVEVIADTGQIPTLMATPL